MLYWACQIQLFNLQIEGHDSHIRVCVSHVQVKKSCSEEDSCSNVEEKEKVLQEVCVFYIYIQSEHSNFKKRFINHVSSFKHKNLSNSTTLSKYIWELKATQERIQCHQMANSEMRASVHSGIKNV